MNSYIKHPAVYGHPDDAEFETTCPKRAWAYAQIFPRIAAKKKQLQDSGRFKAPGRLNGELNRHIETMIECKLADLDQPEEDVYMGVRGKLDSHSDQVEQGVPK